MNTPNDNTLLTANDLGTLSVPVDLTGTFIPTDRVVFYRFTLNQNTDLAGLFNGGYLLNSDIIVDANNDGIVQSSEVIEQGRGRNWNFLEPLPIGNFFLRLDAGLANVGTGVPYSIRLAPTQRPGNVFPDPGNTLTQAKDLGLLPANLFLKDYVGDLDEADYYRFTTIQNGNLGVIVSGLTDSTGVSIIADRNSNGVVDFSETIIGRISRDNTNFSTDLSPGTYFIQVDRRGLDSASQYEITLNYNSGLTVNGTPGNDTLTGSNFADLIVGGNGNDRLIGLNDTDTLRGGRGRDILDGGLGSDTLAGGPGADRFRFSNPNEGIDTITDFSPLEDTIAVSRAGFRGGLLAGGPISDDQFRIGATALDRGDRFLYQQRAGRLFYDRDGNGFAAPVQIAQLTPGLVISRFNILVTN